MEKLTIGNVAKAAGVNVETIHFYERRGIIDQPEKPQTGFRRYPPEVIARVRFVQRAQELGFSLREITELLDLRLDPAVSCEDVRRRAETKVAAIETKIADLHRMHRALGELIAACAQRGRTGECPILDALDDREANEGGRSERAMTDQKRLVEVFSAGCPVCQDAVDRVRDLACPACDVRVLDMHDPDVAQRAKKLGVRSVPAVAVNGALASCCSGRGLDEAALREAGVGTPLE
jgi:MerR family mercuric resistance operon transcriptional regulator